MADDQSNCMGIKRPPLFITILDFIIFLVLLIGILQVNYTENNPQKASVEQKGRIIVCVFLFARFLSSTI
jgi:hypothetical protein